MASCNGVMAGAMHRQPLLLAPQPVSHWPTTSAPVTKVACRSAAPAANTPAPASLPPVTPTGPAPVGPPQSTPTVPNQVPANAGINGSSARPLPKLLPTNIFVLHPPPKDVLVPKPPRPAPSATNTSTPYVSASESAGTTDKKPDSAGPQQPVQMDVASQSGVHDTSAAAAAAEAQPQDMQPHINVGPQQAAAGRVGDTQQQHAQQMQGSIPSDAQAVALRQLQVQLQQPTRHLQSPEPHPTQQVQQPWHLLRQQAEQQQQQDMQHTLQWAPLQQQQQQRDVQQHGKTGPQERHQHVRRHKKADVGKVVEVPLQMGQQPSRRHRRQSQTRGAGQYIVPPTPQDMSADARGSDQQSMAVAAGSQEDNRRPLQGARLGRNAMQKDHQQRQQEQTTLPQHHVQQQAVEANGWNERGPQQSSRTEGQQHRHDHGQQQPLQTHSWQHNHIPSNQQQQQQQWERSVGIVTPDAEYSGPSNQVNTFSRKRQRPAAAPLTTQLSTADSVQHLDELVKRQSHSMDEIHVATAWLRLVQFMDTKTVQPQQQTGQHPTHQHTAHTSSANSTPPAGAATGPSTGPQVTASEGQHDSSWSMGRAAGITDTPTTPASAVVATNGSDGVAVQVQQLVVRLLKLTQACAEQLLPDAATCVLWSMAKLDGWHGLQLHAKQDEENRLDPRQQTQQHDSQQGQQGEQQEPNTHQGHNRLPQDNSRTLQQQQQQQQQQWQARHDLQKECKLLLPRVQAQLASRAKLAIENPQEYHYRSDVSCTLMWAAAKLGLTENAAPGLWPAVIARLPSLIKHLNMRNVCGALWALAKSDKYDSDIFSQLVSRVQYQVTRYWQDVAQQSRAAKAATLVVEVVSTKPAPGPLLETPQLPSSSLDLGRVSQHSTTLNRPVLPNTQASVPGLHAAASDAGTITIANEPASGKQERISSLLQLNSQDLSNLVWACGHTGYPLSDIVAELEQLGVLLLPSMLPQHVANILWAFAAQQIRAPRLCTALFRAAEGQLHHMEFKQIAQVAWAAGKQHAMMQAQGHDNDTDWQFAQPGNGPQMKESHFLKRMGTRLMPRLKEAQMSDAVLLCWAYTHVGLNAKHLFYSLAKHITAKVHTGDVNCMATLLWAFTKQRVYHERFFDAVLTELGTRPLELSQPGSLQMIVLALGSLSESGGPLLPGGRHAGALLVERHMQTVKRIAVVLQSMIHWHTGQELSNMAWAFAQVGIDDHVLWDSISTCVLMSRRRKWQIDAAEAATALHSDMDAPNVQGKPDSAKDHHTHGTSAYDHSSQGSNQGSSGTGRSTSHESSTGDHSRGGNVGRREGSVGVSLEVKPAVTFNVGGKRVKGHSKGLKKLRSRLAWQQRASTAPLLYRLKALECAKLAWAFAKAGHVDEELFVGLSARLRKLASVAPAQPNGGGSVISIGTAARTLWGYAMMGLHEDRVISCMAQHAFATLQWAQPRDVSAMLWSLAVSGRAREDDKLTAALIWHASKNAQHYSCSQLADALWAVGSMHSQWSHAHNLQRTSAQLVSHTTQRLAQQPEMFRLEDICNVMWALLGLAQDQPELAVSVSRHVASRLQGHIPIHASARSQQQQQQRSARAQHGRGTAAVVSKGHGSNSGASGSGKPGVTLGVKSEMQLQVMSEKCDPQQLVELLYALASGEYFHVGLFKTAAESHLLSDLGVLDTEHLVLLIWSYACMLRHMAEHKLRLSWAQQNAQMATGGESRQELQSGTQDVLQQQHVQQPVAMPQQQVQLSKDVRLQEQVELQQQHQHQPTSSGAQSLRLQHDKYADVERVFCHILEQAGQMLDMIAPHVRQDRISPQELDLLWQAHHCCAVWADAQSAKSPLWSRSATHGVAAVHAAVPSQVQASPHWQPHIQQQQQQQQQQHLQPRHLQQQQTLQQQLGGVGSQELGFAPVDPKSPQLAPPFQLHPKLVAARLKAAQQELPVRGRRRCLAELAVMLEGLGYSTLGRSSDSVLAGCGPHWLAAEQGYVKLALVLVAHSDLLKQTQGSKLGAHIQVKAQLLRARGWHVVPIDLATWALDGRSSTSQTAYLQSCINAVLGN